jgi:hypothetical protein
VRAARDHRHGLVQLPVEQVKSTLSSKFTSTLSVVLSTVATDERVQ